jgi:hypothetical protein
VSLLAFKGYCSYKITTWPIGLFLLTAGMICLFGQVMSYVWLKDDRVAIRAVTTAFLAMTAPPVLYFLPVKYMKT